ncbi:MAG: hypothetical protein CR988_05545 [Treponema sp.]|nr:MAG: hypothetical protein CR988_05545 [Treponema sp.]
MNKAVSTFDKLVQTISSDEANDMLSKIQSTVSAVDAKVAGSASASEKAFVVKNRVPASITEEPFLLRLLLRIISFVRSTPVEKIYDDYLIKSLGRDLKRQASTFINIDKNTYTSKFYDSLRDLRKAQMFFSGLLTAYDSEKGKFYMLVSSFIAPSVYESLMAKTDPSDTQMEKQATPNLKANLLRSIDEAFSQLTGEHKAKIYACAKGIEWMKSLCDIPLDKVIFRFDVNSENDVYCSPASIQNEMQMLSSVLASSKRIPEVSLQALFLLCQQDIITGQPENLQEKLSGFLEDAIASLECIHKFVSVIPLMQIIRYVGKDIKWTPLKIDGGEEWFVFFKHAWKERFNEKWGFWASKQQKEELSERMLIFLKQKKLMNLAYTPWKKLTSPVVFKRELSLTFIKTFLTKMYNPKMAGLLKTLVMDGKFYRKENKSEITDAFANLRIQTDLLAEYERLLSPDGEIGDGFAKLKSEKLVGLKFKNTLDMLMRSVETNAKQLSNGVSSALKSMYSVLTGVLTGGKTGIYATIANKREIKGANNREYIEDLEKVCEQVKKALNMLETLEKIESNG